MTLPKFPALNTCVARLWTVVSMFEVSMERLFTEPDIVSTFSSLVKLLLGDSMFQFGKFQCLSGNNSVPFAMASVRGGELHEAEEGAYFEMLACPALLREDDGGEKKQLTAKEERQNTIGGGD